MDSIANFLTSVRNAYLSHRTETAVPASRLIIRLAELLQREGYLTEAREETSPTGRRQLRLVLRYLGDRPAIERLRRISKPGRRLYAPASRLPRVRLGLGTVILSTPAGLLTDREARTKNVGGEVVAEVIRGGVGSEE